MKTEVIKELQDLRSLSWTRTRKSSGTVGSFLKAYSDVKIPKLYYKLSRFDSERGIVGHECVNEIIVDRLLTLLGVEHLHYRLLHAAILIERKPHEVYLCASEDFKGRSEHKIALDAYYQAECEDESSLRDFCIARGWEDYIYKMLVVDFLILNRDRHGANIEVLRDNKKRTLRLAPLFDHGLSLILEDDDDTISAIDVLEDKRVQCCLGSSSVRENLELIPKGKIPKLNRLQETDRQIIFRDLETVISPVLLEKTWEMIWRRWCYFESFCAQRQ